MERFDVEVQVKGVEDPQTKEGLAEAHSMMAQLWMMAEV